MTSISVYALLGLGSHGQSQNVLLLAHATRIAESVGDISGRAQDHVPGRRLLRPSSRRHSTGHFEELRGVRPRARIGNGAAAPTATRHLRRGHGRHSNLADTHGATSYPTIGWTQVRNMLDWVLRRTGTDPKKGIFMGKGSARAHQPFTYGRFMCWISQLSTTPFASPIPRPPRPSGAGGRRTGSDGKIMAKGSHPEPQGLRPALRHRRLDASSC